MRITTFNANGIRSAASKGFFDWFHALSADILCLQEIKAQNHQLTEPVFQPENYHCFYLEAEKKGYSGVGLLSKQRPDDVIRGLGWPDFDREGRYLEARFGNLSVVSLYLPSGTSGPERQAAKFDFLARFRPHLRNCLQQNRNYIFCGDFNIAHRNIDLKNWRSNQKNSGFLPEERAWLDSIFDEDGWVDAFRRVNAEPEQYTWWSNRGQARAKNVGWRIDYHIVSPDLASRIRSADIHTAERFSDHAPLTLDYDLELA